MPQSGPQIDTTTPTLTSVVDSPATGDLGVGKSVTLTLNLNEAVTVSGGTPTLTLNDGGVATYSGGSGTNALTFTYTVGAADVNVASLAASSVNLNGATIANGAGTTASLSLSGVSQSGPQIGATTPTLVASGRTVTLLGGSTETIIGSNDTIQALGSGDTIAVVGSGDTVNARAGDTITIGGNGQTGSIDTLSGSSETVILQANSNLNVLGSTDAITVGANSNLSVTGHGDTVILGSGDNLWFSSATTSEVVVGKGVGATIESFVPGAHDIIDLINGAGGYSTTAAVMSALTSDGAGGSFLALGANTLHIMHVAPSALTAQNFKIG